MFYARISEDSPRYRDWLALFDSDCIPIREPVAHGATLDDLDNPVKFYRLDLDALTHDQVQRLAAHLARQFDAPLERVTAELAAGQTIPILAKDTLVEIDVRGVL
jgi:hypothetical protein